MIYESYRFWQPVFVVTLFSIMYTTLVCNTMLHKNNKVHSDWDKLATERHGMTATNNRWRGKTLGAFYSYFAEYGYNVTFR